MKAQRQVWDFPRTPIYYYEAVKKWSAISDERLVINYIKRFKNSVVVVSLGIGTGRELEWLDKIKNVLEIIGIDYSQPMLNFCKEITKKYKKKIVLFRDDITKPTKLKKEASKIKKPIIYICLLGTFGDFFPEQRRLALQKIKSLMKKKDRLILCLYKIPKREIIKKIDMPPYLKVKSEAEKAKLTRIMEYSFLPFFWYPLFAKYKIPPRFWYDEKENDMAIYIGKEKVFISHRFSEEEIKKLCQIAKLKIEKLIEGKFMWIVILKIWL